MKLIISYRVSSDRTSKRGITSLKQIIQEFGEYIITLNLKVLFRYNFYENEVYVDFKEPNDQMLFKLSTDLKELESQLNHGAQGTKVFWRNVEEIHDTGQFSPPQ